MEPTTMLPAAVVALLTLGGGAWFIKAQQDRFLSKAFRSEDDKEEEGRSALKAMATSMEGMRSMMSDMKADMRMLSAEVHRAEGEKSKMMERVEGLSDNYRDRLGNLESTITIIKTKVEELDRRIESIQKKRGIG